MKIQEDNSCAQSIGHLRSISFSFSHAVLSVTIPAPFLDWSDNDAGFHIFCRWYI